MHQSVFGTCLSFPDQSSSSLAWCFGSFGTWGTWRCRTANSCPSEHGLEEKSWLQEGERTLGVTEWLKQRMNDVSLEGLLESIAGSPLSWEFKLLTVITISRCFKNENECGVTENKSCQLILTAKNWTIRPQKCSYLNKIPFFSSSAIFIDHFMFVKDLFFSIVHSSCLFLEDPVMHFMENTGKPQVNLWNAGLDHWHFGYCTVLKTKQMIDLWLMPFLFHSLLPLYRGLQKAVVIITSITNKNKKKNVDAECEHLYWNYVVVTVNVTHKFNL